ncbi:unnamed protein product [Kluyveromyces dobzhanskii CBS 2104]|uniref:WGS project CCBQ000000000 data, contig 00006 n=1 Tax=Kluyveromyces dobzhanskii CBS 2104 TaxID=1427455 RepID=A0A0A8LAJ8_9SACH|nr:unnamed protein product [Kluyveromyces dobzhanskii CBS 2104]
MSLGFKLKRSRSPDPIGISNYKKQRLIYDFENLSLGPQTNICAERTKIDTGLNPLRDVVNKRMWAAVERELSNANKNDKMYEKIFDQVRQFNSQVIKWYDWRILLFDSWKKWFWQQTVASHEVEIGVGVDSYPNVDWSRNLQYLSNDYNSGIDTDVDMDLEEVTSEEENMDIELT